MSIRTALVLALLLVPLLSALGFWQLHRADEKQLMLVEQSAKANADPVLFSELSAAEQGEDAYLRVIVAGRYDQSKSMLLDNRVRSGQVGYEVITPFLTDMGNWVLINRGWIPAGHYRAQMPIFSTPTERVILKAQIAPAGQRNPKLQADGEQWPKRIQQLDILGARSLTGLPLQGVSLRLESGSEGALEAQWAIVNMKPEKHKAYAVQWFTLAAALILLLLRAVLVEAKAVRSHK